MNNLIIIPHIFNSDNNIIQCREQSYIICFEITSEWGWKGNYYHVQKCCRIPLQRGKYYVDKCCMIVSRMHADAVLVPLGVNVLVLRGSGGVESAHSRGQLSPNTSHILCSTTQDETTWGTFPV